MSANKLYQLKQLMARITKDLSRFEKEAKAIGLRPSMQFMDHCEDRNPVFKASLVVSNKKSEWFYPFSDGEIQLDTELVKVFILGGEE